MSELCSVGYVQTILTSGYIPGITLQRTSVSSVDHSFPYLELLEVLCDIYTCTRNFRKFSKPVDTIPGIRVQHLLYPLGTSVRSVRLCHNTRNCWKFCLYLTSVPVPETFRSSVRSPYIPWPGTSVIPVRMWQDTRGTRMYTFVIISGKPWINYHAYYAFLRDCINEGRFGIEYIYILENSAPSPHRSFDLQKSLDKRIHFPPQLSDFVPLRNGFYIVSTHRLTNITLLTLIATL